MNWPRRRLLRGIGIAIVVAVLVTALLSHIRQAPETYPWGDTAATSIYALRAATDGLPVGAYSRFHWNHPGPLLYELLAPLYALSGYREISLKWTTLGLNVGAMALLLFVLWRRAPMLAVTVAATLVPLIYREQRLLFWAWNPIVPLLPMALAMALSAGVASGRVVWLPILAAVVSFMVQSHIGYAPVSLSMVATSVGLLIWCARRGTCTPTMHEVRLAIVVSALVLATLWAVPIAYELQHRPGNLEIVARFFLTGTSEPHAWGAVLGVFANQLAGPFHPSWELTTAAASEAASWPVRVFAVLQLVLLVATAVRAWNRADTFHACFAVICLVVSLSAPLSIRSIVGPVSDYLVAWVAVAGALNVAVIAAEVVHSLRSSMEVPSQRWRWVLVAYVVALTTLGAIRLTGKHAFDARSTVIRTLSERLASYCREASIARPLLRFSWPGWEGASGVLLQYYKTRQAIAVPDDLVYLVGDPFRPTGVEEAEFYLMLETEKTLPAGIQRHEWLITHGSFRLIRVFR